MFKIFFWIIALLMGQKIIAEPMPYKTDQIGEYYEYDIEGSAKDQALRKFRRKSKKVLMAPLKVSWRGVIRGKKTLKKTSQAVEAYLSGHKMPYAKRVNLNKALTDWEGALNFDPNGLGEEKTKSAPGLLYIPREAWRLLKYSLYLAGFKLPRETARKVKDMVYGTCGFAPQT